MALQALAGTGGMAAASAVSQLGDGWQSQQVQPSYIERFADIDAARYAGGVHIQESATLRYTASQGISLCHRMWGLPAVTQHVCLQNHTVCRHCDLVAELNWRSS